MESNEIQTALAAAVEEVLETMCFAAVSGDSAVPPEGGDSGSGITAVLRFYGSPSGGFRVSVPWKLARVVGAGFLGLEADEISDSQAGEVVCELANMICGSVLSRLESQETFQITHPELAPLEPGVSFEDASVDATTNRWFDLGDGILAVSLELQPAV